MSSAAFEASQLTVTCVDCGHTTRKSAAWFRNRDHVVCCGCGERVDVDSESMLAELARTSSDKVKASQRRTVPGAKRPGRAALTRKLDLGKLLGLR